jgi:hypothetical protein
MPLWWWIRCPTCGWGTVMDTQMFRLWFSVSPLEVAPPKGRERVWCPHCRGEPGRKPLLVDFLGRGEAGEQVSELLFRLKKAGAYTTLPKWHKKSFSPFCPGRDDAQGGRTPDAQGVNP